VKFTYQTDAYVIRDPKVAAKLVAAGNSEGVQVADRYTNKLFEEKAIKASAITKRPITQLRSIFGTDIQQQNISHLIAANEKPHFLFLTWSSHFLFFSFFFTI
jgi:predicted metal-dependent phosphoesterase TrpH